MIHSVLSVNKCVCAYSMYIYHFVFTNIALLQFIFHRVLYSVSNNREAGPPEPGAEGRGYIGRLPTRFWQMSYPYLNQCVGGEADYADHITTQSHPPDF